MKRQASNRRKGPRKRRERGRPFEKGGGLYAFKPKTNSVNGQVHHRGPDVLPRKQVIATVQMNALFHEQLRDPRTGRLSRSKWAKGVRAAGLRDLVRYYARALYEGAHGDPRVAAWLVSGVTKLGDHIGAYLDDKPPATGPRTTIFMSTNAPPNSEIPSDAGQRQLTKAEGRYEEVREEDAR